MLLFLAYLYAIVRSLNVPYNTMNFQKWQFTQTIDCRMHSKLSGSWAMPVEDACQTNVTYTLASLRLLIQQSSSNMSLGLLLLHTASVYCIVTGILLQQRVPY